MWHPAGHVSWESAVSFLSDAADELLSLVSLGSDTANKFEGTPSLSHTAPTNLMTCGFADDWDEGSLIVGITTVLLLVNLIEEFPPVATNLDGKSIALHPVFLWHKDQIEYCYFSWPIRDNSTFKPFFQYAKAGRFDRESLMHRFAFIDPGTGGLGPKNGTKNFLVGGLGFTEDQANETIEFSRKLKGFVLSWERFPDKLDLRRLFCSVEADDLFTAILDRKFGHLPEVESLDERTRKIGRPRKRDDIAKAYWREFPNGHEAGGLSLKEAARRVGAKLGIQVTAVTLSRGLQDLRSVKDQK